MAIVRDNSVTQGFSGMLDNLIVFRQLRGKTVVSKRPRPARRQSPLQKENRGRFRDATFFAKAAMHDPQKKAYYRKKAHELKLPNAYTAAITDYMRKQNPLRVMQVKHNLDKSLLPEKPSNGCSSTRRPCWCASPTSITHSSSPTGSTALPWSVDRGLSTTQHTFMTFPTTVKRLHQLHNFLFLNNRLNFKQLFKFVRY